MSDLRFGSGHSAALTAGLIGTMMVPLVVTAPAKAATITKTLEWNDGQPTQNADPSIVEGGVTYRLISQTEPVVASNATSTSVTLRAQKLTATVTHGPNENWPDIVSHPADLFPETVQSDDGNGTTGTLRRSNVSSGEVTPILIGRTMTVSGNTADAVRQQIPSSATNVNGPTLVVQDNKNPLWQATYTSNEVGGQSITYTATYPSVTVQKSTGTKRWTRTATYQSIDNVDTTQQQQQLAEAQRQEEERRAREQEEEAARQREQEAAAAAEQAKTVEDAKSQSNQLIASVESQLGSADAQYISDETKQQAQSAIDALRQALDGNDLVNINTAQGSLRLVSTRMTEEITAGKGTVETTSPDDGTTETTGDDDSNSTTGNEDGDPDDDEDEDDDPDERPQTSPHSPDDEQETKNGRVIGIIPIAAGVLGLVAAGGIIAGVIVSKNKKKKQEEQQQQLFDENGNPIDPNAIGQGVAFGPDGQPIDPSMVAGMAGVATAAGVAGAAMSGETVPQVTVMPAVEELESLALIPGYVPIADSQCQLFSYLNDDENMPVQVWTATISPADDIPTLVEVPLPESEEDAFVAGWPEEDGSYRISTDENGEPVYQTDDEGNPILDGDGNPMPDFVIPQYFIVFAEEDLERAVSNGLLVYSDDGQEIYRGELGLYNEVDATVLWNILNDQLPDEERTDIIEEITSYIGRLDEIEDNNDAMIADYEARRQQQIEEAEEAERAAQEAQEAAAAQATQTSGDEFSVAGYQGVSFDAMGDYGVDSTNFEDVTDGIQGFGEPGAEYDPMNMTGDGFSLDGQMPYGENPYDGNQEGGAAAEGFQTFDSPGDDFEGYSEDDFEDDFDDVQDEQDGFEAMPPVGANDFEAMPPADADDFEDDFEDDFDDFEDIQDEQDDFDAMPPVGTDDFEAMPPAEQDGFEAMPPAGADDFDNGYDSGYGSYDEPSYDSQDSFGETTDGFMPSMDDGSFDGYQQESQAQGYPSDDDFDDDFADFDDFEASDDSNDGYDNRQGEDAQETDQPQPMPAYASNTAELDPEDFFDGEIADDFDDFEDMSDDEFGDIGGAVEAVKDAAENMADKAGDAVEDAVQEVQKAAPRIKIPERKRSRRRLQQ